MGAPFIEEHPCDSERQNSLERPWTPAAWAAVEEIAGSTVWGLGFRELLFRVLGFRALGFKLGMLPSRMEDQMANSMENEMETGHL